jgi:hypothetical protein
MMMSATGVGCRGRLTTGLRWRSPPAEDVSFYSYFLIECGMVFDGYAGN